MQIFIKLVSGRTFVVSGSVQSTIAEVKDKIYDKEHIPVHQQVLRLPDGKLLLDLCSLQDYNIESEDTLLLERDFAAGLSEPMDVFVKHVHGMQTTFTLDPTTTVSALKDLVYDQLGIPVGEQCLRFEGQVLSNEDAALVAYGVNRGCVVYVTSLKMGEDEKEHPK